MVSGNQPDKSMDGYLITKALELLQADPDP
jgi:hypothetical protein